MQILPNSNFAPKKAIPYAVIHNEVKRQFDVPSYQLIPEKEFDQVLEFLAKWWQREAPERPVPQVFLARQDRLLRMGRNRHI